MSIKRRPVKVAKPHKTAKPRVHSTRVTRVSTNGEFIQKDMMIVIMSLITVITTFINLLFTFLSRRMEN